MEKSRPRYDKYHWARDENKERALSKYLDQYEHPYSQTKFDVYKRFIGDCLKGMKILDYGGGAGYMSIYCANHGGAVTLVDIELEALETAAFFACRNGVQDRLICLRSAIFPEDLKRETFDLIIAKDIIEHIPNDKEFLSDLASCQKIGGRIILSTQNYLSLNGIMGSVYYRRIKGYQSWYGWDNTHLRFYTVDQITKMLKTCGYSVTKVFSIYILPYGVSNYNKILIRPFVYLSTKFDRIFGAIYPFNRWGWNFIVEARKPY